VSDDLLPRARIAADQVATIRRVVTNSRKKDDPIRALAVTADEAVRALRDAVARLNNAPKEGT
jgi:hypothetical protein